MIGMHAAALTAFVILTLHGTDPTTAANGSNTSAALQNHSFHVMEETQSPSINYVDDLETSSFELMEELQIPTSPAAEVLQNEVSEETEQAEETEEETLEEETAEVEAATTPAAFRRDGVMNWDGWRWTWYSERVLPGGGLNIPGRYTDEDGLVCDEDGYICLASGSLEKGTVVDTPFGREGKVYDCGCAADTLDVYVNW